MNARELENVRAVVATQVRMHFRDQEGTAWCSVPAGPGPVYNIRDEDAEEEEQGLRRARTGLCISWDVVEWVSERPGFRPRL